jgi:hypothetical protein
MVLIEDRIVATRLEFCCGTSAPQEQMRIGMEEKFDLFVYTNSCLPTL